MIKNKKKKKKKKRKMMIDERCVGAKRSNPH